MAAILATLLTWLLKSKIVKVGAGAGISGGAMGMVFLLHQDISTKIEKQDTAHKEHIVLKMEPIKTEIANLKTGQTEIKNKLRDIHNHLLNSRKNP